MTATWLGVDVGAARKGFHAALIDHRGLVALASGVPRDVVVDLVTNHRPRVVGIDSPCRPAPDGHLARDGERALARAVCGIRYTPDAARIRGGGAFYAWIVEGLGLYAALAGGGARVVEVFPTAAWTRWFGPRGGRSRAQWTRAGLARLGLGGLPARTNQDERDAIAAAVTARLHDAGATEVFGDELVVPRPGAPGGGGRVPGGRVEPRR